MFFLMRFLRRQALVVMGYQDRPLPLYEEILGLGVLVLKYVRGLGQ